MKQKIIIGLSVVLLLFAIFLIAQDLFRNTPSSTDPSCCGDDLSYLKQIDSSLIGYKRIKIIETGLKSLSGLALNEEGDIFVCGSMQVTVFDSTGNKSNEFNIDSAANCIALEGNNIYLGTGAGVAHYDLQGRKLAAWKPLNYGGFVSSVATNGNYVYAADAASKRILKYSREGELILDIGRKDTISDAPGFILPSLYFDIAFGAFNDLWAANTGRLRLENYSTSGYFQSSWGLAAFDNKGFAGCCNPAHFTIMPAGNFVTYEKGIDKIKVFDITGQFICFVAGAGSFGGKSDLQLGNNNLVKDLAAGTDGRLYILDAYNRINVFIKKDL